MTDTTARVDDLYAILGVDGDATAEDVRAGYRALAHRFHPDHNPSNMSAAKRMQEINEAFAVLNSPERRREYDRLRAASTRPAPDAIDPRSAGRGPRPYYRGKNWGLHNGASAPPEFIVRATPSGFNLVVTAPGDRPEREVSVHSDALFPVCMRVICSPWLAASVEELTVAGGGSAVLTISVRPDASRSLSGWRDGGVSLDTDDPRVYCPDIRITTIFMHRNPTAPARESTADVHEPDLRDIDLQSTRPNGWIRRLFGGGS